jgi:hypothetical protein
MGSCELDLTGGVTKMAEDARPLREFEAAAANDDNICALDLILAAWDEGLDCGLAPEQMAYASPISLESTASQPSSNSLRVSNSASTTASSRWRAARNRLKATGPQRNAFRAISPISTKPNTINSKPARELMMLSQAGVSLWRIRPMK